MTTTSIPKLLKVALSLLIPFAAIASVRAETSRPNVLFIAVDDLKPVTGSYGDPLAVTPSLDRLADRGTQFQNAYCNQAVCGPSRFTLMLGTRSTTSGLYNFGIPFRSVYPDATTMPQYFKQNGYRAEALGKVFHVGHGIKDDEASWSVPHFSDLVIEYLLPSSTDGRLTREEAFFSNAKTDVPNRELPRGSAWESPDVADEAYADGRVASEAILRLKEASERSDPFFMAVGFARPHLPFSAPKRYWDLYDPDEFKLAKRQERPDRAPEVADKPNGELTQFDPIPLDGKPDEEMQRKLIHGYYASMSYMDAQVGRVLDALDTLGLSENTIVVVWGDHGYHLGDLGYWTKHTNYEEANRIPLIFAGPGIAGGSQAESFVETVDIFPTLCELAGLDSPVAQVEQPIDGVSQLAALENGDSMVRSSAYHTFNRRKEGVGFVVGRAARDKRYRIVEWKAPNAPLEEAEYELYDYEDKGEATNVAKTKKQALKRMKRILEQLPEAAPSAPKS